MEVHVTSAKLRGSMFLGWTYEAHTSGRKDMVTTSSDAPIHEDLAHAFQKLLAHLLFITEMKGKAELVDHFDKGRELPEEITSKYKVLSFTTEDKQGEIYVSITGEKRLNTGRRITISTPKINRGNKDTEYEFFTNLLNVIDEIKDEVVQFMEGKEGTRAQTEIEFGDEDGFEPEVIEDIAEKVQEEMGEGVEITVSKSQNAA